MKSNFTMFFMLLCFSVSAQYRIQFFASNRTVDKTNKSLSMFQMPSPEDFGWYFCMASSRNNKNIIKFISYTPLADIETARMLLPQYRAKFPDSFIINEKELIDIKIVK